MLQAFADVVVYRADGTIPIVLALIDKGMSLETALAFMMAATALSFQEMIIDDFTGYLFNTII